MCTLSLCFSSGVVQSFVSVLSYKNFQFFLSPVLCYTLTSQYYSVMEGEKVPDTVPPLLLKFSREIAAGMSYLDKQGFVHRDLAARNILVTEQDICKVNLLHTN